MESIYWLMYANIAVWLGLGTYLCFLAKAQNNIEQRLQLKETLDHE